MNCEAAQCHKHKTRTTNTNTLTHSNRPSVHQTAHTAIHNWHGNVPHGLDLDVGDSVEILEECGPWLRGTCPRKPRSVGLFPRTYIHVKDTARADPIVTECTQVLREWSETWKKLFVVSGNSTRMAHIRYSRANVIFSAGTRHVQVRVSAQSDAVPAGKPP